MLHEITGQSELVASLTKWSAMARSPRAMARDGLLILAGPDADPAVIGRAAAEAAIGSVRILRTGEIDSTGTLTEALGAAPGEVWVIRPDAYVAAVLDRPDTARLAAALRRAVGAAVVSPGNRVRVGKEVRTHGI